MTICAFEPRAMDPLPVSVEWHLRRQGAAHEARNGREGYTLGILEYGLPDEKRMVYSVEDQDRRLEDGNGKPPEQSAAIPTGRYRATIYQSPHHGHVCIRLHGVPGFTGIEINALGSAERLRGCIAVGTEKLLDGVRNCQPALTSMVTEARRMTMREIGVYLNVLRDE